MDLYIITNGNGRYIRYDRYSNRYVAVTRREYATRFEDRDKARHICSANIPKSMGTGYHIEVIESVKQPESDDGYRPEPKNVTPVTQETVSQYRRRLNRTERLKAACSEAKNGDLNRVTGVPSDFSDKMKEYTAELKRRYEKAAQELSDVDSEISDLNHYIELEPAANAYQGWLLYTALRERLQRRRAIKDEMLVIGYIGDTRLNDSDLYNMQCRIESLNDRKYTARRLTSLFA